MLVGQVIELGGLSARLMATGEVGVQVGDGVRYAKPGDLILKPRRIWHAFLNRGGEPARLLGTVAPTSEREGLGR